MTRQFSQLCVYILLLSTFLQTRQTRCLRRLTGRKLSAEADEIRSLLTSALESKPSQILGNNNKRDTSFEDFASADTMAEDNVASESKDASIYDDENDDEDTGQRERDLDDSEYKRSVESDPTADRSADQVDLDAYDDADLHEAKDVAKRETKSEDDYEEDLNTNVLIPSDKVAEVEARSTNVKSNEDLKKTENRREANANEVSSDLNFEKEIEDQIQQRIDSIKEDIKREIERKQQVREIEANNAKYDELEFNRGDNEILNGEVVDDDGTSDSSKRSISRNSDATNELEKSKRSDLEVDNEVMDDKTSYSSKRSISEDSGASNEAEKSDRGSTLRSKRSDLKGVVESENKKSMLLLPVKKRSIAKQVTLVEKGDLRGDTRKDRSSILIPERGHAEIKDELPGDLTLDSNLRLARSDLGNAIVSESSRSARSVVNQEEQRYRRDMAENAENEEGSMQEGNFLFAPHEKPDCRMRRRRSRGRQKKRKHPRHSRRHRAIRESSMDDEELEEERDKRAMSLDDEDAASEYKESFGGFQSDAGASLGRFKRIRRSINIS